MTVRPTRDGKSVPVLTLEEAAALIDNGAVVTISSSSGLGCPDATLAAIGDRFRASGSPQGITAISPIAAGDMYGIKGVDHLAQPGLLSRVIAGLESAERIDLSDAPGRSVWSTGRVDQSRVGHVHRPTTRRRRA
jgi:hypothetical protein